VRAAQAAAAACLALASLAVQAFKLQAFGPEQPGPAAATDRQTEGFLRQFRSDVHERITYRAYAAVGLKVPEGVIAGVRWNDNPPALRAGPLFGGCAGRALVEGLACWTGMVRVDRIALETLTMREKSLAPMRSHFGDMQFLHAMAARSGEPAGETRRNILRWAEFAWRVASGEIESRWTVSSLGSRLRGNDMTEWLGSLFHSPSKKHWTVQDMFLAKPASIRAIALGSLLHQVEDSYSASHVRRRSSRVQENGCPSYDALDPIAQFHTYVGQDTEKHGVCDNAPDWLESQRPGSPIEVLAEIVRAHEEGREWAVVRAILEDKVFRVEEAVPAAAPGACFELASSPGSPASDPEYRSAVPPHALTCASPR
jgi:hypothetical protein